jgi:hypothetical protein
LVAYLVKTQPSLLDVKAANGITPLLLAYRLGRLDAAKVLIDAGADQTTKDHGRNNLLHAALYSTPKVKKLKPMLDLLNRSALIPMLKERNRLEQAGQTPLHQYLATTKHFVGKAGNDVIRMIKMFHDISPENTRQAFKMLNGTGDTPLHTLLAMDADPAIIRAVIDFDQSLLCIENAVGRTPAEVAQDRYIADNVKARNNYYYGQPDKSVSSLVHAYPTTFLKEKDCDQPREHETNTTVAKNWRFCAEIMARNGEPKRTLVSLNSANYVAQRLGEQHTKDRYQFKVAAEKAADKDADVDVDADADAMLIDSQGGSSETVVDADTSELDEIDPPTNAAAAGKTKRRRTDVIFGRYFQGNDAWARPKKEKKEGSESDGESDSGKGDENTDEEEEDDDLFPVCERCGERHYRLWIGQTTTLTAMDVDR